MDDRDGRPDPAHDDGPTPVGGGEPPVDGAEQAAAAARARGLEPQRVRTDQLLDGDVQHVVVEPVPDPTLGRRVVVGSLVLATVLALVGLVAGLADQRILEGLTLGAALVLGAVALVVGATKLLPEELVVQQRHRATGATSEATSVDVAPLGRRSVLGAAVAALAAIGAAFLVPARGFGPSAGDSLRVTPWADGVRAVNLEGEFVRFEDVPMNGQVTVWPEGHVGGYDSQTLLIRLDPSVLFPETLANGLPEGLVAYSRVCTHSGCPVGQLAIDDREPRTTYEVVCPCHQSAFDVADRAAPAGGPATRPLSQLPIAVDDEGHVIALGDYDQPPGPAWWSR